ncbi:MAG: pyruvate dehydrogenase complex dihydrolipoamide acetyltransferase [Microscillaceae bacterium]|nr:pyruvate dehydrogenase complex dihydrolipoamide acetyltransferase [Microscillaceae bacterium]MDW8461292.1 pyruvate dehydrogenase complex dihydrolipoamide acetyltransferase [Cytophagales bacterium]
MAELVLMPKMSDTMQEGVIATWLKKVGDTVKAGEPIAEVETDKATMELESYFSGTILHIIAPEKQAIPVNAPIAIIGNPNEDFSHLLADSGIKKSQVQATTTITQTTEVVTATQTISTQKVTIPPNIRPITLPKMSDTMQEGVLVNWLKKVGDTVKEGEPIAEVETDKATMELECYEKGTILYQIEPGTTVPVDGLIAIIGEAGADYKPYLEILKSGKSPVSSNIQNTKRATEPSQPTLTTQTNGSVESRIKISPLAKRLAKELGYDITKIKGTGEGGRIVKRDIENFIAQSQPTPPKEIPSTKVIQSIPLGQESYEEVPVSQMRKTIARRLSESKFSAPHFYLTIDIDMDKAIAAREAMNQASPVKISFNDMIVKATAMALRKNPKVNASWLGDRIRYNHHIHIGVAVAIEEGLLVPVVRFADTKSLSQIAAETKELAKKAKDKKLQPADWEGNTFSISNLGMFGIEEFTAIINPPDACILAVGGIKQVPVVKNGQIVIGNVMKVTLSCDHRVVDGALGAAFLQTLKEFLEEPVKMLV